MKILIITGDYWHAPGPMEHGLRHALSPLKPAIDAIVNPDDFPLDAIGGYDLVILARDGNHTWKQGHAWLSEDQESRIEQYVTAGGRLLGIHSGLCTYSKNGPLRRVMKGHFVSHPPETDVLISAALPDHPVCRGIEPFTVFDEQYVVDVDPAQTTVFLHSTTPTLKAIIAGWTHPVGKGLFVGLTPGHTRPVLGHPMMTRVIRQAVEWMAG